MKKCVRLLCAFLLLCAILVSCDGVGDAVGDVVGDLTQGETGGLTELAAPSAVWIEDGYLCWNAVEFASRYTVSIDGKETSCDETKYSLADVSDGDHTFLVKANGDGTTYSSSAFTEALSVKLTDGAITQTGTYGQFGDLSESYLGYGFDVIRSSVFSDKFVKLSSPIFKTEELLNQRLLRVDSKYSYVNEIKSSSMEEFSSKWNAAANVGVAFDTANIGGSVELEAKYSNTSKTTKSIEYQCISITNQKFYIVMQSDLATYRSMMTEAFKSDLYSDMSPATFFDRYGTHFITSAVMGGKINSYYLHTSETEKSLSEASAKASAEVRAYMVNVDVDLSVSWKEEFASKGIDITNTLEVLGGGDFAMLNATDVAKNYAAWEKSLDIEASLIGIKDSGSLWAIWELIDPSLDTGTYSWVGENGVTQYGSRAEQLQAYFYQYGVESYNSLLAASGLPEVIAPESITNIRVNGNEASGGEYVVYAGVENDITFAVLPQNATAYTKSIALATACDYAYINDQNQLVISTNAEPNALLTVVVSAGGVRTQIQVRVIQTYTVNFMTRHPEGYTIESRAGIVYGDTITKPTMPGAAGYTFVGWYQDADCTQAWNFLSDYITKNMTLYGKWEEYNPTVTFKDNCGLNNITSVKVAYGECLEEPDIPVTPGYTFGGFYSGRDMVREFDFTQPITDETTIYVKWYPDLTVTFASTATEFTMDGVKVPYNTCMTTPVPPVLTHYVFGGWYADPDLTYVFDFTQKITQDTVIYAKCTPKDYTVMFESNGGSSVATQTLIYGIKIPQPETPTKTGYSFAGWYYDEAFENRVNFAADIVDHDMTLFAKWSINVVLSITFDTDGGEAISTVYVEQFGTLTEGFPTPVRSGYVFEGWYTTDACATGSEADTNTVFEQNTVLYAKWSPISYTIIYDSNSGSGNMSNIQCVYDVAFNLSDNVFTKTGYTFLGWSTDRAASIATYSNGQAVQNLTATAGETVTLYAIWEANHYTVVYNANGGQGTMTSSSHVYNVAQNLSQNLFIRSGYTFDGWKDGNGVIYKNAVEVVNLTAERNGEILLNAQWTPITYTVIYNANGGSGTTAQSTHTYDVSEKLSPNGFSRAGWIFLGWSKESAAITATYLSDIAYSNLTTGSEVTLYAIWLKAESTVIFSTADGTRDKTVTDADKVYDFVDPGMNVEALKANGYTSIQVTITFDCYEINWGYQELWVSLNKTGSIHYKEYESANKKWVTHSTAFTLSLDSANSDCSLYIEWGSHGDYDDDWKVGYTAITIIAIK